MKYRVFLQDVLPERLAGEVKYAAFPISDSPISRWLSYNDLMNVYSLISKKMYHIEAVELTNDTIITTYPTIAEIMINEMSEANVLSHLLSNVWLDDSDVMNPWDGSAPDL